jgi:tRNA threonylcarbamoyl adenosine modification protein YeaZ
MTLTLALDTATDCATLAIGARGEVLAEITLSGRRHAAALLPGVEQLVRLVDASLGDLGRVLVADGPGSFTGLRIGVATVQGLVRARPEITVGTAPSLLAAAWRAAQFHDGAVAALYDALRGEVYGAVYRFGKQAVHCLVAPRLATVDALMAACPAPAVVAVGDGAVAYADAVRGWTGRDPVGPPAGAPAAAALLALDGAAGGTREVPDVMAFEPDYGRPAEAQVRWERAHGTRLPDSRGDFR